MSKIREIGQGIFGEMNKKNGFWKQFIGKKFFSEFSPWKLILNGGFSVESSLLPR